ncbi:MAG: MalY/PatB family protein [Micrococcales bacterium]
MIREPKLEDLRKKQSSKWRRYPADVLPLHVAEMDFDVAEPVVDVLAKMVTESNLGYLGPVPEVGEAFAGFAKRRWGWQVDASQVKIATDVGVAAVDLMRSALRPGDRVVISSPVYSSFYTWIAEAGCEVQDVPLTSEYRLDLPAIEAALAAGARAVLLCNPQNPTGTVHSKSELQELARIAEKHSALVISDEIHAPLTFESSVFVPYLSLGAAAEATGITLTSNSKSWNTAGLKASIMVSQSAEMAAVLNKTTPANHWRSSILGAFAMVASFNAGEAWLDEVLLRLDANRRFLEKELYKIPGAKMFMPESTYLAWVDLSETALAGKPFERIFEEARVAFVSGDEHGKDYGNFVRINFATSQAIIADAINRIVKIL